MFDYIILGMLSYGSSSGYDLKKIIDNNIRIFYKASYGSLYPALKKLVEKRFITLSEESKDKRNKKIYSITDEGLKVFNSWLVESIDLNDNSSSHLVKVYFFDKLSRDDQMKLLSEYEINNMIFLNKLENLEKEFRKNEVCSKDYYYKLSTLYYGICILKETIRWCRHIKDQKPLSKLSSDKSIHLI